MRRLLFVRLVSLGTDLFFCTGLFCDSEEKGRPKGRANEKARQKVLFHNRLVAMRSFSLSQELVSVLLFRSCVATGQCQQRINRRIEYPRAAILVVSTKQSQAQASKRTKFIRITSRRVPTEQS